MSAYIDRAKKKVRRLKIENFDRTLKNGHLQIAGSFDQTHRCPLFRGLTVRQIQNVKFSYFCVVTFLW